MRISYTRVRTKLTKMIKIFETLLKFGKQKIHKNKENTDKSKIFLIKTAYSKI